MQPAIRAAIAAGSQDWQNHAACRGVDPELFFPIGTMGPVILQIEQAKQVCRRCPVRGCVWHGRWRPARTRGLGRPSAAPRSQSSHDHSGLRDWRPVTAEDDTGVRIVTINTQNLEGDPCRQHLLNQSSRNI